MIQPFCTCFEVDGPDPDDPLPAWKDVVFHTDQQDTTCAAWHHLLALIDEAAADGRETFAPLRAMTPEERVQIVTLPPTIARLTAVKDFNLYRSNLVRIPPEIGAMTSLERFTPYTSYRLHWLPYELTRCQGLRDSTISTRALYGNYKYRWPFPALSAATIGVGHAFGPPAVGAQSACSVCTQLVPTSTIQQVWLSLRVATDVVPLLVHVCSAACRAALPPAADGYVPTPHHGGLALRQPPDAYGYHDAQPHQDPA